MGVAVKPMTFASGLIAFNNVLHALAPLGRSAMVELVGDYHITFRGGNLVPCRDHRCGICHKLQVLRCESGREVSKVRHLVGEHVLVGAEQEESHLRIVLHKFGDDDKLAPVPVGCTTQARSLTSSILQSLS